MKVIKQQLKRYTYIIFCIFIIKCWKLAFFMVEMFSRWDTIHTRSLPKFHTNVLLRRNLLIHYLNLFVLKKQKPGKQIDINIYPRNKFLLNCCRCVGSYNALREQLWDTGYGNLLLKLSATLSR